MSLSLAKVSHAQAVPIARNNQILGVKGLRCTFEYYTETTLNSVAIDNFRNNVLLSDDKKMISLGLERSLFI